MSELKACPFCGGKAGFNEDDLNHIWVSCTKCGTPTDTENVFDCSAKENLAQSWNNRPYENKLEAEAVREAKNKILSGIVQSNHKYMVIDGRYCYVPSRALDEHTNKLERGDL